MKEQVVMEQLAHRLAAKFTQVPANTVETVVKTEHARFDGRPVRDYVPLFVERRATSELAAL